MIVTKKITQPIKKLKFLKQTKSKYLYKFYSEIAKNKMFKYPHKIEYTLSSNSGYPTCPIYLVLILNPLTIEFATIADKIIDKPI